MSTMDDIFSVPCNVRCATDGYLLFVRRVRWRGFTREVVTSFSSSDMTTTPREWNKLVELLLALSLLLLSTTPADAQRLLRATHDWTGGGLPSEGRNGGGNGGSKGRTTSKGKGSSNSCVPPEDGGVLFSRSLNDLPEEVWEIINPWVYSVPAQCVETMVMIRNLWFDFALLEPCPEPLVVGQDGEVSNERRKIYQ